MPSQPSPSPPTSFRELRASDFVPEWPRLTRYYGVPPHDLQHYPTWLLKAYLDAIPQLASEEQLWRMSAADHPHLTDSSRKSIARKLMLMVNPEPEEGAPVDIATNEGVKALESIGIKVVIEGA